MTRVSVAIMAHPARAPWVPMLADDLDRDPVVVWDRGWNDRHTTGLAALRSYDPQASHHLVLQDDAVVCRDLVAGVEHAMTVAGERLVSLYVGRLRPKRQIASEAATRAEEHGAAWIAMPGPWWGVGVVVPTSMIDALADWFERSDTPNYDRRIEKWADSVGVDCWYTHPSLVDHRTVGNQSLHRGRPSRGRAAHRFIGTDASALTVDWTAPVVTIDQGAAHG